MDPTGKPQNGTGEPLFNVDKTFVEGTGVPLPGTRGTAGATGNRTGCTGHPSTAFPFDDTPLSGELGSGVITERIGSGGMAHVYRIWNERLEIFRAVKVLRAGFGPSLAERFETEAKITAKLHHPNIVEIQGVGEHNGNPYLEMEFIDGVTLETLLEQQKRFPAAVACSVALLVARALEHAHSQEYLLYGQTYHGIIHRDLKPANVMISNTGIVKLTDFGIARPTQAGLHTMDGGIVGTMQYLSPEQLDGISVDCRTDIYSLGCVLYELLTGHRTFPQEAMTELMKAKALNEYRRPLELYSRIPPPLDRITRTCLERKAENRYASAALLGAQLERALKGMTCDTPEQVVRAYVANPHSIPDARRRAFSPLIPASAAVVIAGGAIGVWLALRGTPRIETEAAPIDRAPSAARESITPAPLPPSAQGHFEPVEPDPAPPAPTPRAAPPPSRAPAPAAARRPPPPAQRQPPPALQVHPLAEKYGTQDHLDIAQRALRQRNFADARTILLQQKEELSPRERLLLAEAYLGLRSTDDAANVLAALGDDDAQTVLLRGQVLEYRGQTERALALYQKALVTPTILSTTREVRANALYRTAVIREQEYLRNPTPEGRLQTLNAWNSVKRMLEGEPKHRLFIEANRQLSQLP